MKQLIKQICILLIIFTIGCTTDDDRSDPNISPESCQKQIAKLKPDFVNVNLSPCLPGFTLREGNTTDEQESHQVIYDAFDEDDDLFDYVIVSVLEYATCERANLQYEVFLEAFDSGDFEAEKSPSNVRGLYTESFISSSDGQWYVIVGRKENIILSVRIDEVECINSKENLIQMFNRLTDRTF